MIGFRVLNPVGHGGFDIERIDGTTVAFDCGSSPNECVRRIIEDSEETFPFFGATDIDYLFFSHFDKDHINGLEHLLKFFCVKKIIIPYIPERYCALLNVVSNKQLQRFKNSVVENRISLIQAPPSSGKGQGLHCNYYSIKSEGNKWEWIYKSLFEEGHWKELIDQLGDDFFGRLDLRQERGIDDIRPFESQVSWSENLRQIPANWGNSQFMNSISDGVRVCNEEDESQRPDLLDANLELSPELIDKIKDVLSQIRGFSMNGNGLVMLSKRISNVRISHSLSNINTGFAPSFSRLFRGNDPMSACLYTGDMIFNNRSRAVIWDLLNLANEPLLEFQIPHHGSSHNSSDTDLMEIPTHMFFVHDKDDARLRKNTLSQFPYIFTRVVLIDQTYFLHTFIF